jgi:N-acetylglucosamine-6-phosphate deacetylase
MKIHARRYDTGQAISLDVCARRGAVTSVAPLANVDPVSRPPLPWIAPGFVDLQINGYAGIELTSADLTPEDVARLSREIEVLGVTQFLPTATTHSEPVLAHVLKTIAAAVEQSTVVARHVPGIHLEGPFLSPEDGPRGAHPREHIQPPNRDLFRRLQDAAGGRIRLVTLSPEYPETPEFIERAVADGVVVAIGHTAADSAQIAAAVDAGASLSTHLGNGAHPRLPRHPNYIWDQLADDRLAASLIVDGHHLPPAVVKSFVRAKTANRCVLVSDVTGMAGMFPGNYAATSLGDVDILEDGRLVVAGQTELLAGASQPISVGIGNVMRFADVDLATAIHMATCQPASLINCRLGAFEPNGPADFVLFEVDDDQIIRVQQTVVNAEQV